jgi:hypothetical protein
MKIICQTLAAIIMLLTVSCSNKPKLLGEYDINNQKQTKPVPPSSNVDDGSAVADSVRQGTSSNQGKPADYDATNRKSDWDKKIIKTSVISIQVKNSLQYGQYLKAELKNAGGYISAEEQNKTEGRLENNYTLKIPVDQFDNVINLIENKAEKIVDLTMKAAEVSTEMVDVQSRMESKKKIRDRYLDMLKQAKNMSEILQVQQEINSIQVDIESTAGRMAFLRNAVAYSTIQLNTLQVLAAIPGEDTAPTYGHRIIGSFVFGLKWISEGLIFLINLWPVWAILFAVWFFLKRRAPQPAKGK